MSLLKSTELYFYRGLYFGYSFPGFPRHDVVNVGLAAVDQEKDHVDESQGTSQPNTPAVVEFTLSNCSPDFLVITHGEL